jgi:hypothetical protein
MRYNKIAWVITLIYLPLLAIICALMQGCATTGTISPEIIEQSAVVDTSISGLQSQQSTSAESIQAVTDTTDAIEQTAVTVDNPVLTKQVATLKIQVKTLSDSLKAERDKTSQIQSDYSTYKVSSGTTIADQSSLLIKKDAQIASKNKWIAVLAIILFVHLLLDAAVLLLKFYFHKI